MNLPFGYRIVKQELKRVADGKQIAVNVKVMTDIVHRELLRRGQRNVTRF